MFRKGRDTFKYVTQCERRVTTRTRDGRPHPEPSINRRFWPHRSITEDYDLFRRFIATTVEDIYHTCTVVATGQKRHRRDGPCVSPLQLSRRAVRQVANRRDWHGPSRWLVWCGLNHSLRLKLYPQLGLPQVLEYWSIVCTRVKNVAIRDAQPPDLSRQ